MATLTKTCVAHAEAVEIMAAYTRLRIGFTVAHEGGKSSARWVITATVDDTHPWCRSTED